MFPQVKAGRLAIGGRQRPFRVILPFNRLSRENILWRRQILTDAYGFQRSVGPAYENGLALRLSAGRRIDLEAAEQGGRIQPGRGGR